MSFFIPKGMTGTICPADQTESVSIDSLRKLNLLHRKNQGHILALPVGSRADLSYDTSRLSLEYVPMPPPPPRIKKIKEKQADHLRSGFITDNQKGFWGMFLFSLCLHLVVFLFAHDDLFCTANHPG